MTDARALFERFLEDHYHVMCRLASLRRAISAAGALKPGAEHELLADLAMLRHQFSAQVPTEEHVFYPALVAAFPDVAPAVEPLQRQHEAIRRMAERVAHLLAQPAAPDRDARVVARAKELSELIRTHIRNEEQVVFGLAVRELTEADLAKLTAQVDEHRAKFDPDSDIRADAAPPD